MDTPQRQASWLEYFLPDIWAYFVLYLPGEQLGRLMITGATLLRQRLKSPNVVKAIKLGSDYIKFQSFPMLLNEFPSLEELSIYSRDRQWSRELNLKLGSIPSGLRKLELSGEWAKPLFSRHDITSNHSKHFPHLKVLHLESNDTKAFQVLTRSPHGLTSLSLSRWNGTVELPSTLIHFEVIDATLGTDSVLPNLPPSLESFVVKTGFDGANLVVPLLPPSTRKLCLGHNASYLGVNRSQSYLMKQLPRSLTRLQLPFEEVVLNLESELDKNPELISHLPSSLTELTMRQVLPCLVWPLLPPYLTSLTFEASEYVWRTLETSTAPDGSAIQVEAIPFDRLPRTLTQLEIRERKIEMPFERDTTYFCRPPSTAQKFFFPPHLRHLKIPNIQLSLEIVKLLPCSLTYLESSNLSERVCEHLPTGLKTLISKTTLMSPNMIRVLPKTLTFLQLAIPPQHVILDFPPLPPTLTHCLLTGREIGDSFLYKQKLPNLLTLELLASRPISDLSIPLLPRHLTKLHLGYTEMITGRSFPYLPRGLTFLNLGKSQLIFDPDIQYLPRTLKCAYLCNANNLTALCIPGLPPHLAFLSLRYNTKIKKASYPDFPYSLRSSQRGDRTLILANWAIKGGEVRAGTPKGMPRFLNEIWF